MKPFLSFILPVYGSPGNMPLTLMNIDKKLSESGFSYEVLVVSAGSDDKINRMIGRFSRIVKNLKLLEVKETKENRGLGWVLRNGMLAAKGNYRFFVYGVGSIPVGKFEDIFLHFKEGYQLIVGSRNYPAFGFFTEEAAVRILNAAKINGWGFMGEAVLLARLFGFRIKEIGLGGGFRLTVGSRLAVLRDSIRIRYWLKRGVYQSSAHLAEK